MHGMELCGNVNNVSEVLSKAGLSLKEVPNFPRHLKVILGVVFNK